jgi:hypothetical protein
MNGRFEGIIQKVNAPKYSEKYGVWSISLKENGKWTSVWRKDQSKADELYRLLVKRMKCNGLGIDLHNPMRRQCQFTVKRQKKGDFTVTFEQQPSNDQND